MRQVRGRKSSPSKAAPRSRRSRKQQGLARFLPFLSLDPRGPVGRRLAALHERFAEGNVPRWPGVAACAVFYCATGLYAASLNGTFNAPVNSVSSAVRSLAGMTLLPVEAVEITGQSKGKREEVLAALGSRPGDPILGLDTHAARARVEALPWVKSATVLRLLPGTIQVSIEARAPYAIWQRGGRLSVIDHDGQVVSDLSGTEYAALPLVVGDGANEKAHELLEALDRWPSIRPRMRAAIRVADRRWNIRLLNGIDIRLPETGVVAVIDELAALDETYGLLQRDIAAVDFRLSDRITIRLSDEAALRRDAALKGAVKARSKKSGEDT